MDTLPETLTAYQAALDQMATENADALSPHVMSVILSRDRLARVVLAATPAPSELSALAVLDQRLQQAATHIDRSVGRATLAAWREAMLPPAAAWWWRLDERAANEEPRPSPLWAIIAGFFLTISISITADIARRFLAVGPDAVGVFSTLLQGFLTFLAGRSLIGAGQQSLERLLAALNIQRRYSHIANTVLALLVLLLVIGLRLALPLIAAYYSDQGVIMQQNGNVTGAIMNYQRAISLSPNDAKAHYNLGTAYEDVTATDLAIASYQTALRNDAAMYRAYNNLARVYMAQRNDFASALPLLNTALELPIPDAERSEVRYALLKNRGWANLGLTFLRQAETDLRDALAIRPDGASAHCLLAQVYEARINNAAARTSWESCLRFANSDPSVEARWVGLARERLSEATTP
jgi:tetratricopeptide (TPR) repeat protein